MLRSFVKILWTTTFFFQGIAYNLLQISLGNRAECVKLHDYKLQLLGVLVGVPQGSILDPNFLSGSFTWQKVVLLFADNTTSNDTLLGFFTN